MIDGAFVTCDSGRLADRALRQLKEPADCLGDGGAP